MSELIERQAAIDVLKQFKPEIIPYEKARSYVEETIDTMYNRIEELPTIQPEPQWISCRNDLPDIGMTVLFCDIDGDEFIGHRASDYWWSVDDKVKSVIAWMPLPKPFEGGIK